MIRLIVSGNRATASAPNGRFAEGGGIQVQDGEALLVKDSIVSGNTTSLTSLFPSGLETLAGSAGIHIGAAGTATIQGSAITGNTSSVEDPNGSPVAVDAGLFDAGFGQTLVLRNSTISGNRNIAHVASSADGLSGGAVEIDGAATITNTRITGNTTSISSSAGDAAAFGAVLLIDGEASPVLITNSSISGNAVSASTSSGQATIFGAGIVNSGALVLRRVKVSANVGAVDGPSGHADGGGIWNGQAFPDTPTPVLTLEQTIVTGNVLSGSPGLALQGGGIFTPGFPFTTTRSLIAGNTPDQCPGCPIALHA